MFGSDIFTVYPDDKKALRIFGELVICSLIQLDRGYDEWNDTFIPDFVVFEGRSYQYRLSVYFTHATLEVRPYRSTNYTFDVIKTEEILRRHMKFALADHIAV